MGIQLVWIVHDMVVFVCTVPPLIHIVWKTRPVSEPVRWLAHWLTGPTGGSAGSLAIKNHQI
jgi:hypothetical protein